MTGSDQRFVVAGLGSIGRRHLRNLRTLRPDATIAGLRRPTSMSGIPDGCDLCFTSLDEARAFRPTAVILAGPASDHVRLAEAFVSDGAGVLIEKPLSVDLEGLAPLAAAAARLAVPVTVGYNLRFMPGLGAVRAALAEGVVGQILSVRAEVGQYLPDWRPGQDYRASVSAQKALGGGALLELSHEIDYLYWLFGMPSHVFCRAGRFSSLDIDVEDCAEILLDYPEGRPLASVHLDFLQQPPSRNCKFVGTSGTLAWDGIADRYVISRPACPPQVVQMPPADRNAMYVDELCAFLAAVEDGANVPVALSEAIDVMRILAAARQSMESRRSEAPPALETVT